jgi:hypothetical protein
VFARCDRWVLKGGPSQNAAAHWRTGSCAPRRAPAWARARALRPSPPWQKRLDVDYRQDDVRSSSYLEDVATEFHVQGLELDWACVVWDADFRLTAGAGSTGPFAAMAGSASTRARGNVVPRGDDEDPTRAPAFYDETFEYLRRSGMSLI